MIERVAKACAATHGLVWSEMPETWDRQDERAGFRDYWYGVARAAMREARGGGDKATERGL